MILSPTERFDTLNQLRITTKGKDGSGHEKTSRRQREHVFLATTKGENKQLKTKCFICANDHPVAKCPMFRDSENKDALLRHYKISIYCLSHKFFFGTPCKLRDSLKCEICHEQHHTLMHPNKKPVTEISQTHHCENSTATSESTTILPTAVAEIISSDDRVVHARCIIDQGSQSCYISENLVQKLRKETN